VDSSTSAFLAERALGKENVRGIIMPYRTSNPDSTHHAKQVVAMTGIQSETVEITPMVDAYFEQVPNADNRRRGNVMARQRMIVLYDKSAELDALVLGTSNKTEFLLGYTTLWGDMACAVNPLGDLYKTQVWQLAEYLGVPKEIVGKPPSADLWAGQTDEDELGFTYREVDRLLYFMVDKRYTISELIEEGYEDPFIRKVFSIIQRTQYKRRLPVIAKLSHRTIDRDFRYPRDWGV
jgi:NAD+ synthase